VEERARSLAGVAVAALPIAAAIGVFGVIYGAAAGPVLGTNLTIASSIISFSGAAQFTVIALLASGTSAVGVLGAATALAARHIPLGAILRPRLPRRRARRALVSPFLIDETTGLALTRREPAAVTMAVAGGISYLAWIAGTAIGLAGGEVAQIEPLAEALFPVLFIGLAALTATSRADRIRAVAAGIGAGALLLVWPAAGALGAITVAIAVAAGMRGWRRAEQDGMSRGASAGRSGPEPRQVTQP